MNEFLQKYIDEVSELVSELQHTLLMLEKNPNDTDMIESIFRTMHTIKGSAGMFGFDTVVELTHRTESIYAEIQKGKLSVNEKIINLTFSVSDIISEILKSGKNDQTGFSARLKKIFDEIDEYLASQEKAKITEQNNNLKIIYIRFEPDADVEERGVNLKTIFRELGELGTLKIKPKQNTVEGKYPLAWEIFIATEKNIDDVEEILLFVESETQTALISESNLLLNPEFCTFINSRSENELLTTSEIENFVQELSRNSEPVEKNANENPGILKSTLRVDSEKLDELMNRVSELITLKSEIKLTASLKGYKEIGELAEKLEKITSQIRENVFDIRLIPLDSIRVNFERLVRDTAILLKKEVQFTAEGMNTELDKTIVDRISAPIMHILRNSIDHGIEDTLTRAQRKKTAHGNIKIKAFKNGAFVHIEISDDGAGIDRNKLLRKAVERHLIDASKKLSDKEIDELIFLSGLSTAADVSEVSGRGVGMDVVKTEILKLRGDIAVKSSPGAGTSITLKLPLSLTIIDTLLVQTGNMYFSVPVEEIDRCILTDNQEMKSDVNQYLKIDSNLIPYADLRKIFSITEERKKKEKALIINKDNRQSAILVDSILGEYQAVVKPLGNTLDERPFLSGGSLMPDGNIAYMLDTQKLIEYYFDKNFSNQSFV